MAGEKCWHGDGEGARGNLVQRGETSIIHLLLAALGVKFNYLDDERVVEVGGWIVKGEVTIGADAAADDIDGCGAELR